MVPGWQSSLTDLLQDRDLLHALVLHCAFPASHHFLSCQPAPQVVRGCMSLVHKASCLGLFICSVIAYPIWGSRVSILTSRMVGSCSICNFHFQPWRQEIFGTRLPYIFTITWLWACVGQQPSGFCLQRHSLSWISHRNCTCTRDCSLICPGAQLLQSSWIDTARVYHNVHDMYAQASAKERQDIYPRATVS